MVSFFFSFSAVLIFCRTLDREKWTGLYYTPVPRVQWVHLTVPSSVGTEVTNIHWWGAGLRSPYLTMVIMWTT